MPTAATPKPWRRPLGRSVRAVEFCRCHNGVDGAPAGHARPRPEALAAPFVALGLAFADAMHEVEGVEQGWEALARPAPSPGHPRSTPHTWGEPPQPLNGHTVLLISAFPMTVDCQHEATPLGKSLCRMTWLARMSRCSRALTSH